MIEKNVYAKSDLQAQAKDPNRIREFLRFEQDCATTMMEYYTTFIYWPFSQYLMNFNLPHRFLNKVLDGYAKCVIGRKRKRIKSFGGQILNKET